MCSYVEQTKSLFYVKRDLLTEMVLDGDGAKPIKEVGKENDGKPHDYDEVIEEDDRKGVTYLSFIGGSQPKPNKCGLSPKNPGGSGEFTFSIDGKQVFKSEVLQDTDGGKNVEAVHVEFDIPATAKELEIVMGNGDGAGCDHSAIGDAKLLNAQVLAVEPANKLPTIWGHLKDSY